MAEYRPNSHRSKAMEAEEASKEKRAEKVVSGTVTTRDNKSRKLMDMFISDDAANVKNYVIMDVLIPSIKNAISDIIKSSVDMIFGTSTSTTRKSSGGNRVSYRSYYDDPRDNRRDYASSYTTGNRLTMTISFSNPEQTPKQCALKCLI